MKNTFRSLLFVISLAVFQGSSFAQEISKSHADSLNNTLDIYYELNKTIFQAGSKPEDIEKLFTYFTDDFTYVHPKYGGTYSREDLYNGYMNNQANGSYDGEVAGFKITNKIVGLNAIVVSRRYLKKNGSEITEGDEQMTLFEFRDGKISRIFEYW